MTQKLFDEASNDIFRFLLGLSALKKVKMDNADSFLHAVVRIFGEMVDDEIARFSNFVKQTYEMQDFPEPAIIQLSNTE